MLSVCLTTFSQTLNPSSWPFVPIQSCLNGIGLCTDELRSGWYLVRCADTDTIAVLVSIAQRYDCTMTRHRASHSVNSESVSDLRHPSRDPHLINCVLFALWTYACTCNWENWWESFGTSIEPLCSLGYPHNLQPFHLQSSLAKFW